MKLGEFIKKLQKIEKEHGVFLEVTMADGIPVVSPIYVDDFICKETVVITDEE
jgi:hypothetical protein